MYSEPYHVVPIIYDYYRAPLAKHGRSHNLPVISSGPTTTRGLLREGKLTILNRNLSGFVKFCHEISSR